MGRIPATMLGSVVVVGLAALFGCGGRNGVVVDPATGTSHSYTQLLRRVEARDTTVDFALFRFAYAGTKQYDPYGLRHDFRDLHDSAIAAVNTDRHQDAIRFGRRVLKDCYPEIETHLALKLAYAELDSLELSTFHQWVYESLLKSILSGGDGLSTESPFRVISVDEEYALIRAFGYEVVKQALSTTDGHQYDIMELVDPETRDSLTWYFNIDYPFSQLGSIF